MFYAQGVLADLMDWWMRDAGGVDMDYVTAVINDAGESGEELGGREGKIGTSSIVSSLTRKWRARSYLAPALLIYPILLTFPSHIIFLAHLLA